MAAVGSRGLGVTPQDMVRALRPCIESCRLPMGRQTPPGVQRRRRSDGGALSLPPAAPLSTAGPSLLPPCTQDASRLVFVSVKDAKPKRKVAVPIGDGSSWDQFCSQVRLVGAAPGWGGCGQRVRLSFAAAGRAQLAA